MNPTLETKAVQNFADQQYADLLRLVLNQGKFKPDRTGTGTISIFGAQARFDLREFFPLLTTKRVFFRGLLVELLWFLRGDTNIRWLQERNVHIWDEWADSNGDLGRVYGAQWRAWKANGPSGVYHLDQIARVIQDIKKNPDGRRHIVTAWNPGEIDGMRLPPCHCLFQFFVIDGELSCQLYQRSADLFLGVPFNIASYALLTLMVAQVCGLKPGDFVHTFGDLHIYRNHIDQVNEQLSRAPKHPPKMILNKQVTEIDNFDVSDFTLYDYEAHSAIKAAVAV